MPVKNKIEQEKSCSTCKYTHVLLNREPCVSCNLRYSNYKPKK